MLAAWGIAAGLAGGFAISRLMAGIMYGVSSNSIAVLAGVPALLAVVSFAASWIPARAATRADRSGAAAGLSTLALHFTARRLLLT